MVIIIGGELLILLVDECLISLYKSLNGIILYYITTISVYCNQDTIATRSMVDFDCYILNYNIL